MSVARGPPAPMRLARSEEHTSELQSRLHLVCPLLPGKNKVYSCAPNRAAGAHSTTPNTSTTSACVNPAIGPPPPAWILPSASPPPTPCRVTGSSYPLV